MRIDQPKISVIIPSHNYANYLTEAIESIRDQTYSNWECIIIDDGSTDNTKALIAELIKKENRLVYFYQNKSGPTVARNLGVKMSTGDFIQFLDADDLLENKKFEKQVEIFAKNPEIDLVYGSVKYFADGHPEKKYNSMELIECRSWMNPISGNGKFLIESLIRGNIMVISSPLTKKQLFENHGSMDESLFYNEDWELWLRFAMKNSFFHFELISDTDALIRVHKSYSRDNLKMFVYGLKVCNKYLPELTEYSYRKIMVPKINYHKKIINSKLIDILTTDRSKAIETCEFVYEVTGMTNYRNYGIRFKRYPVMINRFLFFISAVFNKLKSVFQYGA